MALSADITVQVASLLTGTLEIEALASQIATGYKVALTDGSGAGQANKLWSDRRTLASGTTENLDLAGSLEDAFGATVTFAKIKAVILKSASENTTTLTLGNVANGIVGWFGAATHSIAVAPGGMFVIAAPDAAGYAVTPGTADLLKIANAAGASADYDIIIIGA